MILKSKLVLFISLLTFSLSGLILLVSYSGKVAYAEVQAVSANWDPKLEISVGTTNARRPAIAAAPNGKTVLVTYTDDTLKNPYYSFSNNNGKPGSWTSHRAIFPGSAAISSQTAVTFDKNNKAHVVWVENTGLAYANSSNLSAGFGSANDVLKVFTNDPLIDPGSGVLNPLVVTFNNFVHIIGVARNSIGDTDIFYVYSSDGGKNWQPAQFITNSESLSVDRPDAVVDNSGNVHLVYNNQKLPSLFVSVAYKKGDFDNSVVSWNVDDFVDITTKMPATNNYEVFEPSIIFDNGRLEVSATQQHLPPPGADKRQSEQFIYQLYCNGACTNAANWNAQRVYGTKLYIDNYPYTLSSDIAKLGGCSNVVFDGKTTFDQTTTEQIFQSSSCSGWGSGTSKLTDSGTIRSIQPVITTQNNWWMYIVYEEFNDNNHKIYFTRNIPGVYLPMIRK